jgi:hypothetical protein
VGRVCGYRPQVTDPRRAVYVLAARPNPSTPPADPLQVKYMVDDLLPSLLNQPNTVIHLHSSLRDPAGLILSTRDYVQHYANDRLSDDPGKENRVLTLTSSFG